MPRRAFSQRGFTLIELMVTVTIGIILVGIGMANISGLIKSSRADDGLTAAVATLRSARELAVGNRRNIKLTFGSNTITLTRVEYCPSTCTSTNFGSFPGCSTSACLTATTTLRTVTLEGLNQFQLFTTPALPDTPDGFGKATATDFGLLTPPMFTTDGSLINSNGDVVSGTVFVGITGDPLSARAVTIFGPTGAMRMWKWNGRAWVEA